jgi:hypothetical protein
MFNAISDDPVLTRFRKALDERLTRNDHGTIGRVISIG